MTIPTATLHVEKSPGEREIALLVGSLNDPYWKNFPEAMSLETGSAFHVRYRKEHIPANIWSNLSQLTGIDAYYVHLNKAPQLERDLNQRSEDDFEYLPVRKCRIITAEDRGDYARIEVVLGDFVHHEVRTAEGVNPYHELIIKAFGKAKCTTGLNGKFIVVTSLVPFGTTPRDPTPECLRNWTRVVKELARFPTFYGSEPTIFLWTDWIRDAPGNRRPAHDGRGRLILEGGGTYRLHVVEYIPTQDATGKDLEMPRRLNPPPFPFDLSLQTDGRVLKVVIPSMAVRGKYDDAFLMVRCAPVARQSYSFVNLRSNTKQFFVPSARRDEIVVTRSIQLYSWAGLAAFAFVFGAVVSPVFGWLSAHGLTGVTTLAPYVTAAFEGIGATILAFVAASPR